MRVIIQTREWSAKDLKIGKLAKWYSEHDRIHKLDSEKKIYEFLYDAVMDDCSLYENYENLLKKPYKNITLNEVHYHFIKRSDFIPILFIATYRNGHYSSIEQLNYNTLNEMVKEITGEL